MQFLVLFSLVAGAFAFLDCPANSHYESCGTACPLTCDNYKNPPRACVLMCNPGCHCDEGYVKAKDGSCVEPEVCPSSAADQECGVNERYTDCGTACPLTCDNYKNPPKICNLMCMIGCECQDGYVRSREGRCVRPEQCPQRESEKNCHEEADGGMCRGYFPMWYFDSDSETCKEFIYGGCQGNGNRYATKEECLRTCASVWDSDDSNVCDLPAETGRCRGFFPRYHFDKSTGECKRFVYGGCGGNGNNFKTEEDCQNQCGNQAAALDSQDCDKAPDSGVCDAYMPRYYYDEITATCKKFIYGGCGGNRNNFRTEEDCYNTCAAQESVVESACEQEKVVGPCRAAFGRYFFNKETGQCEHFIYGGCGGNDNNFLSQDDCEAVCVK
ncbi:papilin [Trichonephila clavata]|uniref:Papilin n=1 Tax=Trichonephila clavata TaxID=2740835 RepID=A0A8X6GUT3_TRICU|nr:papilin [Trichonephila clavata]